MRFGKDVMEREGLIEELSVVRIGMCSSGRKIGIGG